MALVLVTRPVAPEAIEMLRPHADVRVLEGKAPIPSEYEIVKAVPPADALFTMPGHPITHAVIEAAPRLKLIASLGAGYDNIDLEAARARKIPVTHAPGILDETTADLAFGLLLAVARRIPESERVLRAGQFDGWSPQDFLGTDVHGKTIGIVGLGRIGQAMARRAAGFGMHILYCGPHRKKDTEALSGADYVSFEKLLADADFVSLHAPLLPRTRHLIDGLALRQMKRTAILINTARGAIVDEAALIAALREETIAGAGLDVYEREPQVPLELRALKNVVLTPHIGSGTLATRRRMAEQAAKNIIALLVGHPLPNRVPTSPRVRAVSRGR